MTPIPLNITFVDAGPPVLLISTPATLPMRLSRSLPEHFAWLLLHWGGCCMAASLCFEIPGAVTATSATALESGKQNLRLKWRQMFGADGLLMWWSWLPAWQLLKILLRRPGPVGSSSFR
jgi:hypothetical protein